jgi:LAS superfamily LD-carboxypeptidase LdcB
MKKRYIAVLLLCTLFYSFFDAPFTEELYSKVYSEELEKAKVVNVNRNGDYSVRLAKNVEDRKTSLSLYFSELKELNDLILANDANNIGDYQKVNNLIDISTYKDKIKKINLSIYSKGNSKLESTAMANLFQMLEAAKIEKIPEFKFRSGYRNYKTQKTYFDARVKLFMNKYSYAEAYKRASQIIAVPGTSEHQTGLAVDICDQKGDINESFDKTVQYQWLEKNCYKYGFILRYPKEKTHITGKIYEPWHIRYVGLPHSEIMYFQRLCFEEYIDGIKNGLVCEYESRDSEDYTIFYINNKTVQNKKLTLDTDEITSITMSKADIGGQIVTIKAKDR